MLISTTLTGSNENIIGDALRSVVHFVDQCLVIDTGARDNAMDVAREVCGDKLVARTFKWVDDFAAARNFALESAAALGGSWAVTLDTDERLSLADVDVRSFLNSTDCGVVMVEHESRTYAKERFFRLPAQERWTGPTHEAFPGYKVGCTRLEGGIFAELDKTPEQWGYKFKRDVKILTRHTQKHPRDPRWFFYLGESHKNLKQYEKAVEAYGRCASLRGWNEESAWACYRAAECFMDLGKFDAAIDSCARGLALHAGIADLAWLAAFANYKAGRMQQAVYWAELAIPLGHFRGTGKKVDRIGFRTPKALYEGPYDVLRFALRELGDQEGAEAAERDYAQALAARLALR